MIYEKDMYMAGGISEGDDDDYLFCRVGGRFWYNTVHHRKERRAILERLGQRGWTQSISFVLFGRVYLFYFVITNLSWERGFLFYS